MTGNYWEEAVYATPPLFGLDRSDMLAAFNWLNLHFPIGGTKIDWRRAPGRHAHWKIRDDVQLASTAAGEVCRRIRSGSKAEHIGDELSPYGVCFTGDNAPSVVAALLEIPEHHYFIAGDRSWIVVVTTEGDLDVADGLSLLYCGVTRFSLDVAPTATSQSSKAVHAGQASRRYLRTLRYIANELLTQDTSGLLAEGVESAR